MYRCIKIAPAVRYSQYNSETEYFMIKIENKNGLVYINSDVFTTLVGDAATSCFGVKGMAMRSMTDGLVHLLKREAMGKGVYITYNDDGSVTIELHIIIDQGVNVPVICDSIISEVSYKITASTGIGVKQVDVFVDSISFS